LADPLKKTEEIWKILMTGMTDLDENFWTSRYKNGNTGWDLQHPSEPLKHYFDSLANKELHILFPGAGNSYEAEYLWNAGFKNISVLDIAKEPLKNLKKRIPELPDTQIICSDFFEHQSSYDLIIEQTFYCALQPELRHRYQEHMYHLLRPEGKLAGLLFNFPLKDDGPPFGGDYTTYKQQFSERFRILTLEPCYNSETSRKGKELFFIFEKK